MTWAPSTGITGLISTANSLIGNPAGYWDGGPQVYTLTNGNDGVVSLSGGSVTWANGATGITGTTGVITASSSVMAYLPPMLSVVFCRTKSLHSQTATSSCGPKVWAASQVRSRGCAATA